MQQQLGKSHILPVNQGTKNDTIITLFLLIFKIFLVNLVLQVKAGTIVPLFRPRPRPASTSTPDTFPRAARASLCYRAPFVPGGLAKDAPGVRVSSSGFAVLQRQEKKWLSHFTHPAHLHNPRTSARPVKSSLDGLTPN